MAVDYSHLNNKAIPDRFPLPRIDDILDSLGWSAVFRKLDLDSGYYQVSLDHFDTHKMAILCKWGLYEYTVLPLGLTNAPATFLCLMNQISCPQLDKGVAVYLDDTIIYSKNMQKYVNLLEQILAHFTEHQLLAKRSKCEFRVPEMEFLSHIISASRVLLDPSKVESIRKWPIPTSVHDNQVFLRMVGYYSWFVPKYADKAAALTGLLKNSNKWKLTTAAQDSF